MSGCFGGNDWADNLIYIKRRLQNALVLTGDESRKFKLYVKNKAA